MSKVFIQESTLTAIGDAIRNKTGKSALIAPGNMPTEINSIVAGGGSGGGLEVPASITIDDMSVFCSNSFNWLLNDYADRITFEQGMFNNAPNSLFYGSDQLVNAGITYKVYTSSTEVSTSGMFYNCKKLVTLPKLTGVIQVANRNNMFYNCQSLLEIPEEFSSMFDTETFAENASGSWTSAGYNMFYGCYKLRKIPMHFLLENKKYTSASGVYYCTFYHCYNLDRLVDIPVSYRDNAMSSNMFSSYVTNCFQLKDLIFETNEDGSPIVVQWGKQVLNIQEASTEGFYGTTIEAIYKETRGQDKMINSDATYEALKNDPDAWYASGYNQYNPYGHDAAVRTINSLPDTSAYVASKGDSYINTIRFRNNIAGDIDGGGVSNLTEAEIAVAAAKGWTVMII
jgi:hypothetical protein